METYTTKDDHNADVMPESYHLPITLQDWRKPKHLGDYWKPWEHLRSFFKDCGYELYKRDAYPYVSRLVPYDTVKDWRPNRLGVYGTRSYVPAFYSHVYGPVWPARNRDGQEVMLKVMSYKDEGAGEVDILTYLSSEPVKSEIDNPIVSLLELLHHGNWTFAVQPRWSACVNPEFQTVGEGLEFCVQVTKGVAFLHRHLVAHLDIAEENILMNFLGIEQLDTHSAHFLKSWFPVRYGFIDFGQSRRYEADKTPHLADVYTGRFHKAPELDLREPYNPFAADVYQTGSMLLKLFYNIILLTPEFSPIINDMMRPDSNQRISMAEAYQQFQMLKDEHFRNAIASGVPQGISTKFLGIFSRAPQTDEELSALREQMKATP